MPEPIIQRIPQVQRTTHWGELKRCRSLNLTDTCWEIITNLADHHDINRSELIERVMRQQSTEQLDALNRPR